MKKALLLFAALLVAGCGENKPVGEDGVNMEDLEKRGGWSYLKGSESPYTGKAFALHPNGQKSVGGYMKDGKWDGLLEMWYENGDKRSDNEWENGEWISLKMYEKGQKVKTLDEADK